MLRLVPALGWRPSNAVVPWIVSLPRDTTVEDAIRRIPPNWTRTLHELGAALRELRPIPWELLRLLPRYAAHGLPPETERT